MANLGEDLIMTVDYDLAIGSNGDLVMTRDIEQNSPEGKIKFLGQVCLNESIYRIVESTKGEYPFDTEFGANITDYISQDLDDRFDEVVDIIETELLKDDRIASVPSVLIEKSPKTNSVTIQVEVIPVGVNEISTFVFPFLKENII